MKTNYLLSNKYKIFGWILLIGGLILGSFLYISEYESDHLTMNVLAIYNDDAIFGDQKGFFQIIENSIIDELCALAIIIGGLIVGFTKEKIEDEFIYKLRKDSLVWAIIFNYVVLIIAILFVYGFTFFDVLVFNMFTPLLFFIFRFNFLKLKSWAMKNTIKVERAIHNLTQADLAEKIGVSRQSINAMEKNKYVPSTVLALKIAKLFHKPVETIFILEDED